MQYNILVLTDHTAHSSENSVYELSNAFRRNTNVGKLHIASRGNAKNKGFFYKLNSLALEVKAVTKEVEFQKSGKQFRRRTKQTHFLDYDGVILRLPRPIPAGFFEYLGTHFNERFIVNSPSGIDEVGSKKFLLEFPDLTPPIQLCDSFEAVMDFQRAFPIVLKPLENYGGKGILKVQDGKVLTNDEYLPIANYRRELEAQFEQGGYLGMKFLKNVSQGDKRVVVVNGTLIGASLRLPAEKSWLCNAAQGGTSQFAEIAPEEKEMAQKIHEKVKAKGIVIFGMDTLVNDDGKRVLSELNTLSVGGLKQIAAFANQPLVQKTADLILSHLVNQFEQN